MRRALAIDETSFGPEHPRVATGLNNLSTPLQDTNRLAEAESLMRRALPIDEASFGPEHPDVARDLNNLALLLQDTNRLAGAEPLMRQVGEILLLFGSRTGHTHPHVELHTLTQQLPRHFFDSIRADYSGFDDWFRRKAREGRRAWVYRDGDGGDISAICIYTVQGDERITDDGRVLEGEALKLCTFKVGEAVRGRKIGELFLRAAFQFATTHRCEWIFLHANAEQQKHLTNLIEDFGFRYAGTYGGDGVYVKNHPIESPAPEDDPLEYVRRYYPHYMDGPTVKKFLVPIKPQYHVTLFPDWQAPGHVLPVGHPQRHVGNAIKLAYLCHTPSKQPRAGDIVLFYRSQDERAVTTLAVVEHYDWSSSAGEIAQQVSRRTVYSLEEIEELARNETKVMLFRLISHLANPVTYETLSREKVVSGAPQSITQIDDESFSRILRTSQR